MRFRIFTTEFWRAIFTHKERPPKVPEEPTKPEHIPQEPLTTITSRPPEVNPLQTKVPQEQGKRAFSEQSSPKKIKGEKPTKAQTKKKGEDLIASVVRSELNLEQNSIFAVSTYRKRSREVVSRETTSTGEVRERRVIIGMMADGLETGVLTTYHFKVYLALLRFWEEAGKPLSEKVNFTILGILREIGIADTGPNYETVKRLLRQLIQIPLTFKNSFFVPGHSLEQGSYETLEDFHILSSLYIYERNNVGHKRKIRGYGRFQFSDAMLRNLVNNFTHPLRLDVVRGFRKHKDLSILLYIYLDRNLAFKDKYEIGLEKLFDHLDLSQKQIRYPSDRKAKIEPVLEQLRGKELSTGILYYAQILKTVDGKDYKLVCRKKPFPERLRGQEVPFQPQLTLPTKTGSESPEAESESAKSGLELLPLLVEKGLTQKQAAKLVAKKSPEVINTQLEYLPFRLREYESRRKEINEPAILYDSINDNWKVPKGFIKAEKGKEREAERLEQERIARLEQEERDREEQERTKIEDYKESLDPEVRVKLREKALKEIRGIKGIKEEFINDALIVFKENEILRSEMGKGKS